MGRHPLGRVEDLLNHALRLEPAGVRTLAATRSLGARGLLRVRRQGGAGRIPHQRQRTAQLLRRPIDPSGRRVSDRVGQRVGRLAQIIGFGVLNPSLRASRCPLDVTHGKFVGGRLGDPGSEFVGLVDDHSVVVRDHRDPLDGVDRQQGVVRHDQLGILRSLTGPLGEALGGELALCRPQTLPVVDADLTPDPVRVLRGVVPLTRGTGRGLVLGPGAQLQDCLAQRTLGHLHQRALFVRHPLSDAVQTRVVRPALQHGVRRCRTRGGRSCWERAADGSHQGRQVAFDELVLERQGGGCDHDAIAAQQRWHEVSQGLASACAGLDQKMLTGVERGSHRLSHLDLARALLAAQGCDGGGEHGAHGVVGRRAGSA